MFRIVTITQDGHFVIIEVDFIDKHLHQPMPVFGVIDIPFAELVTAGLSFYMIRTRFLADAQKMDE